MANDKDALSLRAEQAEARVAQFTQAIQAADAYILCLRQLQYGPNLDLRLKAQRRVTGCACNWRNHRDALGIPEGT